MKSFHPFQIMITLAGSLSERLSRRSILSTFFGIAVLFWVILTLIQVHGKGGIAVFWEKKAIVHFRHELGFAYQAPLGVDWMSSHDGPSPAMVFENGIPLGPANALHDDIRKIGHGRFSFWHDTLYLSTTDNSDPRSNNRNYEVYWPKPIPRFVRRAIRAMAYFFTLATLLALSFTEVCITAYKNYLRPLLLCVKENKTALFTLPSALLLVLIFTATVPIVYVMTFSFYFMSSALLHRLANRKVALAVLFLFVGIIILARSRPVTKNMSTQDMTMFALFQVNGGEAIEQDFLLPRKDWKLNRLLYDPNIYPVLRIIADDIDAEKATIYVNGIDIGKVSSLLISKGDKGWYGFPVRNYILKLPKTVFINADKITIRMSAGNRFKMAYSNGIHPLPHFPHTRLIKADGSVEDLSSRYYHRRFRFQIEICLISEKYFYNEYHSPLVFGTIL